jgi:replicative DNA helicase
MILHDTHSEDSLLACILVNPNSIDTLRAKIPALNGSFFTEGRSGLYDALCAVYDMTHGESFDLQMVADSSEAFGGMDLTGIMLIMKQAQDVYQYSDNPLLTYGQKVYDLGKRRLLVDRMLKVADMAKSDRYENVNDLFSAADAETAKFFHSDLGYQADLFTSGLYAMTARMKDLKTNGRDHVTSTGIYSLDNMISGGFKDASLNIVAARAGTGKTAFMLQIMMAMMQNQNNMRPVAFVSLEMSRVELADRMIANMFQAPLQSYIDGSLLQEQQARFCEMYQRMFQRNGKDFHSMFISERNGLSIEEISLQLENLAAHHGGLSGVFIDYLGLIKTRRYIDNRAQEVGYITHSLLELGKNLNCPIVCASQLNRQIEQKGGNDAAPKNSYLRESGDIENDADLIMMLTGGDYNSYDHSREIRLHITKNRSGIQTAGEPIKLRFYGDRYTFMEEGQAETSKYIPPEPKNFYGGQPDM